jgi:hypothetical protein
MTPEIRHDRANSWEQYMRDSLDSHVCSICHRVDVSCEQPWCPATLQDPVPVPRMTLWPGLLWPVVALGAFAFGFWVRG